MPLRYITGDATIPIEPSRPTIIAHCCNDASRWDTGFLLTLRQRWPSVPNAYLSWSHGLRPQDGNFMLGAVQFVRAEQNIIVANIIGQHGIGWHDGIPPIRYDALRAGLRRVGEEAQRLGATVQCPRLGAGLASGSWDRIKQILLESLVETMFDVVVFDFQDRTARSFFGKSSRR